MAHDVTVPSDDHIESCQAPSEAAKAIGHLLLHVQGRELHCSEFWVRESETWLGSHIVLVSMRPGAEAADDDQPRHARGLRGAEQVERPLGQRPVCLRMRRSRPHAAFAAWVESAQSICCLQQSMGKSSRQEQRACDAT